MIYSKHPASQSAFSCFTVSQKTYKNLMNSISKQ